jgi:hypothetical protein
MAHLDLRRLLDLPARFVALAVAFAGVGLGGCQCPPAKDEIFLLRNPDAETQALIDACRDPAQRDCIPLCRAVSGRASGTFLHCELHEDRDGYVQVHVGIEEICGN